MKLGRILWRHVLLAALGAFAVLGAVAVLGAGCGESKQEADDPAEVRVPVITEQVTKRDVAFTTRRLGTVEAWKEVTVSAKTSGQILELNFDKGSTVRPKPAGDDNETVQPLAVLEREEYKLRWLEAQAALNDAKTTYERTKRLFEQGSAVQSEHDTAKAAYDVAKARHDLAKKLYDDTEIFSPIAGTVVAKPVEVGELVAAGTPLATIVDVRTVKIVTSLSESDSPHVGVGETHAVHVDAFPQREFEGTVLYKAIKADVMTRSFPVELEVDNADGALRIGMVARVTFALRTEPDAITVPLDALVYRENVLGVFIVEDAETAAFRPVTLGERSGDSVIVTDGLSGGEELVIVGQTGLRPGSKVTWPQGKPKRLSPPNGDAAAEPED